MFAEFLFPLQLFQDCFQAERGGLQHCFERMQSAYKSITKNIIGNIIRQIKISDL